jgi:hypothetical protein
MANPTPSGGISTNSGGSGAPFSQYNALLVPALAPSHAEDCTTLTLTDVTGADCECENAQYDRRLVTCRNITVIDQDGNVVPLGGQAQINCLSLTGMPEAGDIFIVNLNDCRFEYTVVPDDIAADTETRACAKFSVNITATPESLPCVADATLTIGGLVLTFPLTWTNSVIGLAQATVDGIIAALTALNYQTHATATRDEDVVSVCISPSWYKDIFGGNINTIIGTLTFSGCSMVANPPSFAFSGGIFPETEVDVETQTQLNVLNGLYKMLTGQEAIDTDKCGNPVYACPLPFEITYDPCLDATCHLQIKARYVGEPFAISTEQVLEDGSTALFESVLTQVNLCNMKPATSADSDKDEKTVSTPKDAIWCTRFFMTWFQPAYYFRCLRFADVGTGEVVSAVIDNDGDTSLSFTFTTVSTDATANAQNFVTLYNAQLEGLGISNYDVYVERSGTTVCIYIRDGYFTNTSATTIVAEADGDTILVDFASGATFNKIQPSITQSYLTEECFADLCNMYCCYTKTLFREAGGCDCPPEQCLPSSSYIYSQIKAIELMVCEGDICGAKTALKAFQTFYAPKFCQHCQ